jgi:hypothetical protein
MAPAPAVFDCIALLLFVNERRDVLTRLESKNNRDNVAHGTLGENCGACGKP